MLSPLKKLLPGAAVPIPGQPSFDDTLFHFLSLPKRLSEGLPLNATQDEILALTEQAAAALAEGTSFEPWGFEQGGKSVLPLFTKQAHAQAFLQGYVAEVRRILPFQALQVEGRTLLAFLDGYDEVILNPRTRGAQLLRSRS